MEKQKKGLTTVSGSLLQRWEPNSYALSPPPMESRVHREWKKKRESTRTEDEGAEDGGTALTCPPWWPGCDAALNAKRLQPPLGTKQFLLFKNEKVEEK